MVLAENVMGTKIRGLAIGGSSVGVVEELAL
jgi:hypothetical protein